MSTQAFKTISSASNPKLRKAVDWKLFELSANLIGDDVANEDFEEACLWFMKRNAEEVVEERSTGGLCGFPLCKNSLKRGHHSSTSSGPRYRIDYGSKKIYEIEKSDNYCSVTCLERSELWQESLDTISAVSRPIARSLNLNTPVITSNNIDDVLSVISPGSFPAPASSSSSKASALSPTTNSSSLDNPDNIPIISPPTHNHPSITSTGQLVVDIIDGRPILMDASTIEQPSTTKGIAISPPPTSNTKPQPSVDELLETMRALQMKYDLVPKQSKLPAPAIKKMTRGSNSTAMLTAPPAAPEPPISVDIIAKEPSVVVSEPVIVVASDNADLESPSKKKEKRTVVWDLPENTVNNANRPVMSAKSLSKNTSSTAKAPPAGKVLSLTVVERPASEPMSLAAMQLKREPAGAIEGFVPSSMS